MTRPSPDLILPRFVLGIPLVCLAAIALPRATRAQVEFEDLGFTFGRGERPEHLAAGDLDEDGILDLVVATPFSLVLHRGLGNGGFERLVDLGGPAPEEVFVADMNSDGHLDVVATHDQGIDPFRASVSVRLGNGQGQLGAPVEFALEPDQTHGGAVLGDFNEDGHLDVVVSGTGQLGPGETPGRVEVFLNDGTGALPTRNLIFSEPFSLGFGPVLAGDVVEDGSLDLLFVSGLLFQGDGMGAFTPLGQVTGGSLQARLVDLDLDGHLDSVGVRFEQCEVRFGRGDGSFEAATILTTLGDFRELTTADLDGSGRPDLILLDRGVTVETLLAAADPRGFLAPRRILAGIEPLFALAEDLDRNGTPDLIVAGKGASPSFENSEVAVLLTRETGIPSGVRVSGQPIVTDAEVADVDLDGTPDVVATRVGLTAGVEVRFGRGGGDLGTALVVPAGSHPIDGLVADLLEDGNPDIAVANRNGNDVSILTGNGDGTFNAAMHYPVGVLPEHLAVGDFNGDLHLDLAVALGGTSPDHLDGGVVLLFGDGAGGFGPPTSVRAGGWIRGIAVGDFLEDGHLDLAVTRRDGGDLELYRGDGTGNLVLSDTVNIDSSAARIVVDDFDQDGNLDVAARGSFAVTALVAFGDGAGNLSPGAALSLGFSADTVLASADFDQDGNPDLALSAGTERLVLLGDGQGSFGSPDTFRADTTEFSPTFLTAGELNGDGFPDLVTSDAVSVLLNRTPELYACLIGNVNGATGPVEDVLLVNGSAGAPIDRRLELGKTDPFEIRMESPSSSPGGPSPFVVYAFRGRVDRFTRTDLPFGLGCSGMPLPFVGGAPLKVANNIGNPIVLLPERWPGPPTQPAPSVLVSAPAGVNRCGEFVLQGIVLDTNAPNGVAALTNGVQVRID